MVKTLNRCKHLNKAFRIQPRAWTEEEMVYINSARCPDSIQEACADGDDSYSDVGAWMILHLDVDPKSELQKSRTAPFDKYTALTKWTEATMHLAFGDIVMEDSPCELMTHFDFWKEAHGSVLISGLGLGCIARAVAAKPSVTDVTVLEIEPFVIKNIGPEFAGSQKVTIIEADALKWQTDRRFDCAWHDIYTEEGNGLALALLHTDILMRFRKQVAVQGAWNYPKEVAQEGGFKWGI